MLLIAVTYKSFGNNKVSECRGAGGIGGGVGGVDGIGGVGGIGERLTAYSGT